MAQVSYIQVSFGSSFDGVSEYNLKSFFIPRNSFPKNKRNSETMQDQSTSSTVQRRVAPRKDFAETALSLIALNSTADIKSTNTANDVLFQVSVLNLLRMTYSQ